MDDGSRAGIGDCGRVEYEGPLVFSNCMPTQKPRNFWTPQVARIFMLGSGIWQAQNWPKVRKEGMNGIW